MNTSLSPYILAFFAAAACFANFQNVYSYGRLEYCTSCRKRVTSMDVKSMDFSNMLGKADELAKKIGADKTLLDSFSQDPIKTLESKLGINLPDEQAGKLASAIKSKLKLDKAGDLLGGAGKLFK